MADILTGTRAPEPPTQTPLWTVRPPAPPHAVERLVRDLGVPPLLAAMLWGRGLREEALDALQPPLVLSPIPALREAAERLAAAIQDEKTHPHPRRLRRRRDERHGGADPGVAGFGGQRHPFSCPTA